MGFFIGMVSLYPYYLRNYQKRWLLWVKYWGEMRCGYGWKSNRNSLKRWKSCSWVNDVIVYNIQCTIQRTYWHEQPLTLRSSIPIVETSRVISIKLTYTKKSYTTNKKELLSIVETVKELRTILLDNNILVYTDHKYTANKSMDHNCDRVLQQILYIKSTEGN